MEFLKKKGRRCAALRLGLESHGQPRKDNSSLPADPGLLYCPPSEPIAAGNLGRNPFSYLGLCSAAQLNVTG